MMDGKYTALYPLEGYYIGRMIWMAFLYLPALNNKGVGIDTWDYYLTFCDGL